MKAITDMTLDELLSRQDYKKLTEALKERVEDLANRILKKMIELHIEGHICAKNGAKIQVQYKEIDYTGIIYTYLGIYSKDTPVWYDLYEEPDYLYHSLNDLYLENEPNHKNYRIFGATVKDALLFLNSARDIIMQIAEIETQKAEEIEAAL